MEEHLKNKERLESEWTALCAYDADPSATTIAQRVGSLATVVKFNFIFNKKCIAYFKIKVLKFFIEYKKKIGNMKNSYFSL